jgi:poly-gamma-glutamate synthesis protein (capsule biosynthesis protein)
MEVIKILLTGDFCPILRIEQLALKDEPERVFNDLMTEFQSSDLNIVDLECPLVDAGTMIKKSGPHLKASPETIKLLKFANINLVAMANNHIRDYGDEGLLKTILLCKENGIDTVGVGEDIEEARLPYSVTIKGIKVKVLNITDNEWSNTNGNEPGANPLDLIKNYYDIRKAKSESDIVIVIFHGGNEFYKLPSPRMKETLHFFADAGATAVISHHTHVSSGYEVYNGIPIFYSLGNFCYDSQEKHVDEWNYGYAVILNINRKTEFEIIPFVQNSANPGVHKLSGSGKDYFLNRIYKLNDIIANDKLLQEHFIDYCKENAYRYDLIFEPYRNKFLAFFKKRGLLPSLLSNRKKRLFLNIIRCDAHRDILLAYLDKYK